ENGHAPGFGQIDRRAKTRDAASHDDKIGLLNHRRRNYRKNLVFESRRIEEKMREVDASIFEAIYEFGHDARAQKPAAVLCAVALEERGTSNNVGLHGLESQNFFNLSLSGASFLQVNNHIESIDDLAPQGLEWNVHPDMKQDQRLQPRESIS